MAREKEIKLLWHHILPPEFIYSFEHEEVNFLISFYLPNKVPD